MLGRPRPQQGSTYAPSSDLLSRAQRAGGATTACYQYFPGQGLAWPPLQAPALGSQGNTEHTQQAGASRAEPHSAMVNHCCGAWPWVWRVLDHGKQCRAHRRGSCSYGYDDQTLMAPLIGGDCVSSAAGCQPCQWSLWVMWQLTSDVVWIVWPLDCPRTALEMKWVGLGSVSGANPAC